MAGSGSLTGRPASPLSRGWLAPAFLAFGLAGCAAPDYFAPGLPPGQILAGGAGDQDGAPVSEQSKSPAFAPATSADAAAKEKTPENPPPPRPRTFPQALAAYLRSFHEPLPQSASGKDKESHSGERRCGEKNPPAIGREGTEAKPPRNSGAKSQEGREGEKSPPTGADAASKKPPADGQTLDQGRSTQKGSTGEKRPPAAGEHEEKNSNKGEDKEKETEEKEKDKEKEPERAWLSAHAQATMVTQVHDSFPAPYTGPNSLLPNEPSATSVTATLFLDARLWECDDDSGELVFNPELAGGRGLSSVDGIAGFPNGEITRVGVVEPTPYFARLYYRQTWGLGGEQEKVEDEANQIAGTRDVDRITLSVGKFAFTDVMDNNLYSHDPRTQFLCWSLMYNGAWDYPANVRGYDYGVAIEYNCKDWALRYGVMGEPRFANSAALDPKIDDANGHALEWEGRYKIDEHPGALRLLAYLNHAHMGSYRLALEEMPVNPDVTLTQAYRIKYGFCANWQQEVTKDLGVFARLGWNDGQTETWAFTPIDRTACLGLLLKGRCWRRADDTVGLAGCINGISQIHREYLAAGGLDFNIGDGRLNYGPEEILECFYDLQVHKGIFVTADFQEVNDPAYNRDRGPVSIYTLRVHTEF